MRLIRAGEPIYSRHLTHAEAHNRLDNYYTTYHNLLGYFSDKIYEQFGTVYHLNCHSMPSSVVASSFPQLQPDFILGDLDGRSCGREFRQQIVEILKDMGYGTGEEAIRVLKLSPNWIPGTVDGKPARVEYSLPIQIHTEK
jgi:N-formylglutamate amidohydrolase